MGHTECVVLMGNVYIVLCMCVYVLTCVCVHVFACGGQRLTLSSLIALHFAECLSVNLEITNATKLAGQQAQKCSCFCLLGTVITITGSLAWLFT